MDGGATATYVYDAKGQRVRKSTSSTSVDYLYDLAGHEITELNSTGAWNRGEVYAGTRHLATYSGGASGTTYFNHSDWLGTERARSSVTGTLYESCTSLPFGDWLTCTGTDSSPMHFTGKERDTESGLDNFGARYNASTMGRFMSPDEPLTDQQEKDPQSWNLYSYVRNNPLNAVDPNGHDCIYLDNNGGTNPNGPGGASIDHNSSQAVCNDTGGRWANGTVEKLSWVETDPNSDTVHIFSHYRDVVGQTWAGPGWSHGDKYADMISPEKIEEMEDKQILKWTTLSITLPHFGAGFTQIEDVTQPGSRFPNIRVNLTPEEFGENLEANGYTKGVTTSGNTTYTKGDKQYTLYTASSTRGPSAQVKVDGEVVSKIRLQ